MINQIGKLIAYERKKQGITMERLSEGVIGLAGLKRLEDGERLPFTSMAKT